MTNPKTKPRFHRQVSHSYRRLQKAWRKPRGSQSKMRKAKIGKGRMPAVGYGAPKNLRGLHPSGYEEVLVHNVGGLDGMNEKQAVRIAASVGGKKRAEILKTAQEKKIKVLNP